MANSKIINTTIEIYELDLKNEFLEINFEDVQASAAWGLAGCCIGTRPN